MDIILVQIGLLVFVLLGLMHGIYTLRDFKRPHYFAPRDKKLVTVLETAGIGITNESNNFWKAYLGTHLSHSLGILIFAMTYLALSMVEPLLLFHPVLAVLLICTGLVYVILSKTCWFSKPLIGSSVAVALILLGFGVHWVQAAS